ncbi:MAG: amidohydrolase [Bacteroidota bacterium]
MENLKVSLLQSQLAWEDKTTNRQRFAQQIETLIGQTDLILLPEMFTTGFSMAAAQLAEPMDGPTVEWMAQQAQRTGAVVTGSFIAVEEGRYYNRLLWMLPDGNYSIYDKRHLFTLAGEEKTYTAGQQKCIFDYRGWKICPQICYDLRFPVWSRNVEGYDVLFYVANFPARRRQAWKTLLQARAIENQAYTIGVNVVGEDGLGITYAGDSSLIDYNGAILYQMAHLENVFTAELSYEKLVAFRTKLHFLPDQDIFEIKG